MTDYEIEALLQKEIGLLSSSIGKSSLDRSIRKRMKVLAIADKDVYVEQLKSSHPELQELIEEVVVPETWFFRGPESFAAMNYFLGNHWTPKHGNNPVKILSAPCSTGEEAYSLAMSFLSSGWPAGKFIIHGVDISSRAIAKAEKGIYSKNSFRGEDLAYRSQYFSNNANFYCLNKNVRDLVQFYTGNLLQAEFMEGLGVFDVIFFRNILIYFDAHSRRRIIATLDRILAEDGLLFVGHAEANLYSDSDSPFTPAPYRQAFAFRKKHKQPLQAPTINTHAAKITPTRRRSFTKKKSPPLQAPLPKVTPDLQRAREFADKGEFAKAALLCEEYLEQCGPSVQAFYLLGIIRDAADDAIEAEKLFRKALYLDPNHEEVLVFLMLLAEKKEDWAEVKTLKQRIERLHDRDNSST
jgi:chemotaxis protein methyltransferase WspC